MLSHLFYLFAITICLASCRSGALSPVQADTTEVVATPLDSKKLLDKTQRETFLYFWDFAHPVSGLAPERTTTPNVVTSGGSGFGITAIVVAAHRNWIGRDQAVERLLKTVRFLERADRFHGAWSHWLNGETGKAVAFSPNDNGGDLVETSYLINGLLTAKEYFNGSGTQETELQNRIQQLWETVEWKWYVHNGELLWHWSPDFEWKMNMPIRGFNECLITYVLAVASPTYGIDPDVYHKTWKNSPNFLNGNTYLSYKLDIGFPYGGPLFFSQYSFLGLDPRQMQDGHTNYWQQNLKHTLINRAYCIQQAPKDHRYSEQNWGLTASDNFNGYSAHAPGNDNSTISPTAALR